VLLLTVGFSLAGPVLSQDVHLAESHPVYVGARVCARCHSGAATGHQFSQWRTSKHARAYAVLWSDEAKRIAELSGITEEPQKASACLGCHTTAWDTEPWQRLDTFLFEDGVQCERCHGAGSDYIDIDIMTDPEDAAKHGLKKPSLRDCVMCHKPKGSHELLGWRPFDLETWKARISHPVPAGGQTLVEPRTDLRVEESAQDAGGEETPRYVGVMGCSICHAGPEAGYQFSRWRLTGHARAFGSLATTVGYAIARAEGVEGDPQESDRCLRCHVTGGGLPEDRFLEGFDRTDGVQCESCHGAGSVHASESIDTPQGVHETKLAEVTEQTCIPCHDGAHGASFDPVYALAKIAHPTVIEPEQPAPRYKTPLNMAISTDGSELYVACEAAGTVIVVDLASKSVATEIEVGGQATDVAFGPDGRRAFVSSRLGDSVAVIDVESREVVQTLRVGDEPHGLLLDKEGKRLYVLNTSSDSISVIDAVTLEEAWRLSAGRRPWSLALSPDGTRIAVTSALPELVPFRTSPRSELTLIDAETGVVVDRVIVPDTNLLQGVAWHPSGDFALFTLNRTKNLVPMTRLLQGWTITNGLGVLWRDGRVDQVLLDEPNMGFPNPTDVAITPDGSRAFVTSSGTDRVAVVEISTLISMLEEASDEERKAVFPNHLGKPTEFVIKHIPTLTSPRGLVVSPDGETVYVANGLDDSVSVIDVSTLEAVDRIDLGGPDVITLARYGERLFNSADIAFNRQFACQTCHPDGHVDGISYDIEPDGIGLNPVDNRTLRGILDTAPFKWTGINETLQRQCGPRLAVFFTRIEPFTPAELSALTEYISTIPRPPNRHRSAGAELTPAQRRGKVIFERTRTDDGRPIPPEGRCVNCHFPPLYTDRLIHDVGTKGPGDTKGEFDSCHLTNIYDSAPYLHNGIAHTLEEIWTLYNPYDLHGVTNDLTKDQLNDLIEYLKTL
jgi:YVTN family beta-propeller protein